MLVSHGRKFIPQEQRSQATEGFEQAGTWSLCTPETSLWQHRRGERSGEKNEEEEDSKELISEAGINSGEVLTPIVDHQVWKP